MELDLNALWTIIKEDVSFWSCECTHIKEKEFMGDPDVWGYLGHSFLWMLAIVAIIGLLLRKYSNLPRSVKNIIWRKVNVILPAAFIITWVLGFLTYCVGTWVPEDSSFFSVVPMAIIHATEMFAFQSDISAIHDPQHNNAFYMFLFNLSHFSAMMCTMAFVLHHFGFYFLKWVKLVWHTRPLGVRQEENLYVFWGINNSSLLMAEDIQKQINALKVKNEEEEEDVKKLSKIDGNIVFVRTFDDDESQSNKIGFQRFFDMIKMKDKELDRLHDIDCFIAKSSRRLSKLDVNVDSGKVDILRKVMKLGRLCDMIKKTSGNVNILLMGEDEDSNIRATVNLLRDVTVGGGSNVHIYCHACKNDKNRFVEYYNLYEFGQNEKIHVHLVDSAYLSVMNLRTNVKYHPVNMVDVSDMATVEDKFSSLIIGFGQTGEEAFRFLYEFSSFIRKDNSRTPFNCTIIDQKMEQLKGAFLEKCPGISTQVPGVNWCNEVVGTTEFWNTVNKVLKDVNCIVLTLNNDEIQINLMIQLFRKLCAIRDNEDLKKVKIFVRVYSDPNASRIKDLAKLIRELNQEHGVVEDHFKGPEIIPFGIPNEMFTYKNILDNSVLTQAKKYNLNYQRVLNEIPGIQEKKEDKADLVWNACFEDMKNIMSDIHNKNEARKKAEKKMQSTNCMLVIQDVIRQIEENVSNCLHQETKIALANHQLDGITIKRVSNQTKYEDITEKQSLILMNLAKCEHERWIASHTLKGYVYDIEKDHRRKTHNDIIGWETLDESTRSYDCSVVDTTLLSHNIAKQQN